MPKPISRNLGATQDSVRSPRPPKRLLKLSSQKLRQETQVLEDFKGRSMTVSAMIFLMELKISLKMII